MEETQKKEKEVLKRDKNKKYRFNVFRDLKNVKKNWRVVSSNPYAALKFRYHVQRLMVVLFTVLFIYQFIGIINKFNGGSSLMTLMGRSIMLLILVLLISNTWKTLGPIKRSMKYYENEKSYKHQQLSLDNKEVRKDIDDIINKYGNKSERGENKK